MADITLHLRRRLRFMPILRRRPHTQVLDMRGSTATTMGLDPGTSGGPATMRGHRIMKPIGMVRATIAADIIEVIGDTAGKIIKLTWR